MRKFICIYAVLLALLLTSASSAADWPQFRGPDRDGKSAETGLLKKWPQDGPKLLWSADAVCGIGFSSVAVADGMVYTTGLFGDAVKKEEAVVAYDVKGEFKWKTPYSQAWTTNYPGARSTPTVDSDRLYVMSSLGVIACLDSKSGKLVWKVDTADVFKGKNLKWGIAESPVIYKDKVICTPGGEDATMVALDKMTGKTIWTTKGLSEKSAYCSAVFIQWLGKTFLCTNVQKSIIIVDPENGDVVYKIPHEKRHELGAVSPVFDKGMVYVTTGYSRKDFPQRGMLFQLSPDPNTFSLKWTETTLDCHHGGLILLDGFVHGANSAIYPPAKNETPPGTWYCLSLDNGQVQYQSKLVGKGSVIYADKMLYCYGETGDFALVKPAADKYEMISSFKVTKGSGEHWAHPAVSGGRLYIRHGEALMVYDISE